MRAVPILTVNAGSSSLKAALYSADGRDQPPYGAQAERIGEPGARLRITDAAGATLVDRRDDLRDHAAVLGMFLDWLAQQGADALPGAVGHRMVHGGGAHREPQRLTEDLRNDLQRLVSVDPDHLPQALAAMRVTSARYPGIPEVVCFDTSFHRSMPRIAQLYALPRALADAGVIRYGFHGLSCEFIVHELEAIDRDAARGRIVIAHLGNGASLTAVRDRRSLDTTMGFTPTGGLMMGTRSGDLDPGVLLYLLNAPGTTPAALDRLVNHEAGLLGVSGTSGDMRDLLDTEASDPRAAEAVALFCYTTRKYLGALVAALGGLDTLVFTAGIGEHAAPVRERICEGWQWLGMEIDGSRNRAHAPIISGDGSRVIVRVMKTDEDLMIARHVRRLLAA